MRRSAAFVTAHKKGSSVRRISDKYLKAKGMRGNVMKQQPQWGRVQTKALAPWAAGVTAI